MKMVMNQRPTKFSPWPYAIIATFVALAFFDAGIVFLAIRSPSTQIDDRPYDISRQYQQIIEAKHAALRDKVVFQVESRGGKLLVTLANLSSAASFKITISCIRPNDPALDFRENFMTA